MKRLIFAALLANLLLAMPARAADETKDVEKAIDALNAAFTKGDVEAIKRLTADEHVAITPYYGGLVSKADTLKTLPELKVKEYKVADMQVTLISKDVAFVSYKLTQKGTYKGKDLIANNIATAVWVLRSGKWLERTYQETPLEGK